MNQERRKFLPILFLTLFAFSAGAQEATEETSLRKKERAGEKAIDSGDWEAAKKVYKDLLNEEPGNSDYNFYMGLAYYQSGVEREKAASYFERVNAGTIPQRDYFYGQALHYDGQYDEAIKKFNNVLPLALENEKGQKFKAEIERFIAQCNNAKSMAAGINNMLIEQNLGAAVNTVGREYAPVVHADRSEVIFAATDKNEGEVQEENAQALANENIFFSKYTLLDDEWSDRKGPDGEFMNTAVNTSSNESPIAYDAVNDILTIYRDADLYVSKAKATPEAQNIDVVDLTADDMTAIYQSKNGMYRFVVTDIFPGKGGMDIFYSKKENETWGDWLNLENLNTPYNEDSPFLAKNGTLYFSSEGHSSIGGQDIFKAEKSGQSWANPVNLGMPINSPGDDIHFSIADDKEDVFYLASNRKGTLGSFDIYRIYTCYDIDKTTIKGNMLAEGSPLKDATIYLKDADSNQIELIKTADDGTYTFTVQTEASYIIEVSANNYLNQVFAFNVPNQCVEYALYQSLSLDIKEDADGVPVAQTGAMANAFYEVDRYRQDQDPQEFFASLPEDHRLKPQTVKEETVIESPVLLAAEQFKDVRFGFDSDELAGTADAILNNVASYLGKFEMVTLVLRGHTDTKGSKWYNKQLSKRRANAVASALIAKGVDEKSITVEYYGEEKPLVPDYDAEGNYLEQEAEKNRRVEIEVVIPENDVKEAVEEKSAK